LISNDNCIVVFENGFQFSSLGSCLVTKDAPDIRPDNPAFYKSGTGIWPNTRFDLPDIRPDTGTGFGLPDIRPDTGTGY
jgi:hypothetical protein